MLIVAHKLIVSEIKSIEGNMIRTKYEKLTNLAK